ncbi:hypothetical protein [Atopococcus tabaci]|uniref:hypothetical protein n=1 Tax=Atopococcus tabaci TaxID=269774 RepID=UPI00041D5BF3|nr:hypothetical protein [Atopococcus tabaci]
MWIFTKEEELNSEKIKELKNQWFTMEEAIEELSFDGKNYSESSFRRDAAKVNTNKEFAQIGKPMVKEEKLGGKGRPRKVYNRAFVEALRTFAISDSYKQVEEEPIEFFINNEWKDMIKGKFQKTLKDYKVEQKYINIIVEELLSIVNDDIIQNCNALVGQNKLLVHQNKKLEDTKEYYISLHRGVEENANILNNIANHIKNDISESSSALSRKEVYHLDQTLKVNNKLDEILKLLKETKSDRP